MVIGIVISVMISIVLGISILPTLTSSLNAAAENVTNPAARSAITVIPYIFVAVIILGAVTVIGSSATRRAKVVYNWRAFGNRIKEGYAAKFGGANKGFNEEVDIRIKGMQALGEGYTKSIERDWLKGMASMVEVPWAVPEEEHLSEVDKTREFADASNLTEEERKQINAK